MADAFSSPGAAVVSVEGTARSGPIAAGRTMATAAVQREREKDGPATS
jgi:hypothetical protein